MVRADFSGQARQLDFYVKSLKLTYFKYFLKTNHTAYSKQKHICWPRWALGSHFASSYSPLSLHPLWNGLFPDSEMCIFPAFLEPLLNSFLFVSAGSVRQKLKKKNVPRFGGYVYKKISPINIAPNHSFVKAAWSKIKLRRECNGWLSRWLGGNESHSSRASGTGRTVGFLCLLTAAACADRTFLQRIFPHPICNLHFRTQGGFGSGSPASLLVSIRWPFMTVQGPQRRSCECLRNMHLNLSTKFVPHLSSLGHLCGSSPSHHLPLLMLTLSLSSLRGACEDARVLKGMFLFATRISGKHVLPHNQQSRYCVSIQQQETNVEWSKTTLPSWPA